MWNAFGVPWYLETVRFSSEALLPYTGGFEGLLEVVRGEEMGHEPIAEGPAPSGLRLDLDPVAAQKTAALAGDDVLPSIDALLNFDAH
jgi:hypothetical protein